MRFNKLQPRAKKKKKKKKKTTQHRAFRLNIGHFFFPLCTLSRPESIMTKKDLANYSLYLVTDSTPEILGGRDICQVVEDAIEGGVTIVQYRDKKSDTAVLIEVAQKLHRITSKHNVPLLINDRVDVALAIGCEGVHLGQDDMSLVTARRLLGPDAIIGISASTREEALTACADGADYLGIGAVFSTNTKTNTKHILGPVGIQHLLEIMHKEGFGHVQTVAIGGINATNVQRVFFQSATPGKKVLDGVAIVSAIMAAPSPRDASKNLLRLIKEPSAALDNTIQASESGDILALVPAIIKAVHESTPLSHNMTNLVVQNFAANVALAVGASPIMANYGEEAADLAKLGGALVINMGTVTPEGVENYVKALRAYNAAERPVVLDPVGAGATTIRREAVKTILSAGHTSVIKGNEGEIAAVLASTTPFSNGDPGPQQRGVDSVSTLPDDEARARLAARLAAQQRGSIVVMTGPTDIVSDGERTFAIVQHGDPILGRVTGTGCCLGTVISAMLCSGTSGSTDKLVAVVAGILLYEIAAEVAAGRCQGPGSFVPAFIDALDELRRAAAGGDVKWMSHAKIVKMSAA
ncbi:hypothetical protein MCOR29_009263 [Pyricularia oryzae]|nr:hypothetical protein MCOR29_009263 [Pyricularia oryzae]